MTTSLSSLRQLQAHADKIAQALKRMERGEKVESTNGLDLEAKARNGPSIKFAVAMSDKTLIIDLTWATIAAKSEAELAAFLVKHMRGERKLIIH
jgi:hypothetical protein